MCPKISVIIPVYNKEKYLAKTLDSVIAQTYKNIEIILVNDGSIDKSPEIMDKYAEEYENIKCIHKKNEGVTRTRLRGVSEASGEWIGFVDADDYLEPEMYEILINNALKNNVDISHCGCQMVSVDGTGVTYYHNTKRTILQNNSDGIRDILSGLVYEPSLCNKLYKKSLFDKLLNNSIMDFSIKINEDLLMNYYLFKEANMSFFEDICPYHYISTENSASKAKFTTDPIKVLKIIYNDGDENVKRTVYPRIITQLINYSSMTLRDPKEIRKKVRIESRSELRKEIFKVFKSSSSKKTKILALWCAIWPWSYGAFKRTYSKLRGTYSEYGLN